MHTLRPTHANFITGSPVMSRFQDSTAGFNASPNRPPTSAPRLSAATDGDETFGQRLRGERERRQITLEAIAAKTKISAALFEGLERDNVSRWPAGVFRRAFIRSYAQAIGLNPDAIVREFFEHFPEPAVRAEKASDAGARPAGSATTSTTLRLTMEDTRTWFAGGRLLNGPTRRWAAVGCDMTITVAIGLLMFAVVGAFWMPLAVSALTYYAVSIIVLGNTPGVCLLAPPPGRPGEGLTRKDLAGGDEPDILQSLVAARQVATSNKGS